MVSALNIFYDDIVKTTPALGPAPNRPDAGEAAPLDPARARVLAAVREASTAGEATVEALADAVGSHANTVRHHLAAAGQAGLVDRVAGGAAGGPGRPAARYRLTPRGEQMLGRSPGMVEEYLALAGAFADRLAEQGGDPGVDARGVGRAWGRALSAGTGQRRRDAAPDALVVDLLRRLGFSPERAPRDVEGPGTVLLRSCPLLDAARRHPEVVCQVHRGLVEGALSDEGGTAEVQLQAFARPGSCVLVLPPETAPGG